MITVKAFAQVREVVGKAEWHVNVQESLSVNALSQKLITLDERWATALQDRVLIAVNQTMCDGDCMVNDHDEVAFFPPVTGG